MTVQRGAYMAEKKKPAKKKKIQLTPEQTAAQLELLLKRFDLRVETLEELNKQLKGIDIVCWQGSAING